MNGEPNYAEQLQQIAEIMGAPFESGAKIVQRVKDAQSDLANAREDTARLDWLANPDSPLTHLCLFPSWGWSNRVDPNRPAVCERLRDAIDAARSRIHP